MAKTKDAIAILKQDHRKVRELLSQLEETTGRSIQKRQKLLAKIVREVKIHATVEEEIFYPAVREILSKKDAKLYFEALEEHHVVDLVIPEIEDTDPASDEFGGKAKVLKDLIEHHAKEEEKEMFPKVRESMKAEELQELGARIEERKRELAAEG
jgi:hemerythrin superfamily protein